MTGTRFEVKYLVPDAVRVALTNDLMAVTAPDPHVRTRSGEYEVHSLYFDSPQLRAFHEKEAGIEQRIKLRLRCYGAPGSSARTLELKERINSRVRKTRVRLDDDQYARVLAGRFTAAEMGDEAMRRARFFTERFSLRPLIAINYRRRARMGRSDRRVRVTFDSALTARSAATLEDERHTAFRMFGPGWRVLEFKFDRLMPAWAHQLIAKYSLADTALSKYYLGLEELQRRGAAGRG